MKVINTKVWEVYIKDSQSGCLFLTEDQARNQTVFTETDLVAHTEVYLTQDELDDLNNGLPVFF